MGSLSSTDLFAIVHLKAMEPCPFAAYKPRAPTHSLVVFVSSKAAKSSKDIAQATASIED
jgi:hypothetical protein